MTQEHKNAIIAAYNAAHDRQVDAEARLDAADTDKAWSTASNAHSFALGTQNGINRALELLGYEMLVDDEIAVDIVAASEE